MLTFRLGMCSVGILTTDLHRRCVQWSTDYTDTVSSGAPTCTDGVLQWSTDYTAADVTDTPISLTLT